MEPNEAEQLKEGKTTSPKMGSYADGASVCYHM